MIALANALAAAIVDSCMERKMRELVHYTPLYTPAYVHGAGTSICWAFSDERPSSQRTVQ